MTALTPQKSPTVLVIVVTYNGMKWLQRCLSSVAESSMPLDCYVVDNGSDDGSQQFIADNYPQYSFEQSPKNLGFGAANNIGLEYAIQRGYDYVYLLNQDAWIEPNTISTMVECQGRNPEYGVLSPLQTNPNKDKIDPQFEMMVTKNRSLHRDAILGRQSGIYDMGFIMAAHWLISKEVLLRVGLFSPIFFHYGEDDNYLHRVIYHGFKIGVVPKVFGIHDREFRIKDKRYELYMLPTKFLVNASDINRPFSKAIFRAYKKIVTHSIKKAIKYRDVSFIPKLMFSRFVLKDIYKDRKKNSCKANF